MDRNCLACNAKLPQTSKKVIRNLTSSFSARLLTSTWTISQPKIEGRILEWYTAWGGGPNFTRSMGRKNQDHDIMIVQQKDPSFSLRGWQWHISKFSSIMSFYCDKLFSNVGCPVGKNMFHDCNMFFVDKLIS